ncbi:MAG: phytanoyl-CoA dioxygenase family protein [Betaproteobacteria bacterium]|nr:phytanoyl-CoA dioxygenase family protein [Betaproteobacteria bacterium]
MSVVVFLSLSMMGCGTFEEDGYVIVTNVLTQRETSVMARVLERVKVRGAGTRNLLGLPLCRTLVKRVRARLENAGVLPISSVAVQCTLFDKTPQRNWSVASHQDLSIPVRARVHHPALGGWSEKEGEQFVQTPPELLEKMLAVRIHIDDCGLENGPLRLVPGSHRHGRMTDAAARQLRADVGEAPFDLEWKHSV